MLWRDLLKDSSRLRFSAKTSDMHRRNQLKVPV
jgi:hypothetical protein